ncbi:MAG: hypothetical protein KC416_16680, partial [Myxococcales bacterium]|nr:hypothetical protein [Myxococcales bacterium]
EPDSIGLTDYLHSRGHDFDADVDAGLNNARRSLDQLGQPLSEAIFDQPETIESIVGALQTLQRTIQVDIMGALGLAVTFNDNDGD